jgi:hypothetical protein
MMPLASTMLIPSLYMKAFLLAALFMAAVFGVRYIRADDKTPRDLFHAFSIGKETNQNYVNYDVWLKNGCQIDKDDPLKIYWVSPLKGGGRATFQERNFPVKL